MQLRNDYIDTKTTIATNVGFPKTTFDYGDILKFYELDFSCDDYYYRVGKTDKVQGWILHISTVVFQIPEMFQKVLPLLVLKKVSFKMASNLDIAKNLLLGNMGIEQLGKLMSIYPINDKQAVELASELIEITRELKSPMVPTDIYLGGAVYTRYGSINPVMQSDHHGRSCKYIYDSSGRLVRDYYSIPFQLPEKISWPYHGLSIPALPPSKKILKKIYKPLSVLKEDVKGDVYKGLYLKSLFRVWNCVIKQGRKHFSSDEWGRDMHDRLLWQYELHNDLRGEVPLPAIYDFFQEAGDTYLVMEFIKGISLYDYLKQINLDLKGWQQVAPRDKLILVDLLLQVISIIERLHKNGYVHRDIAPGNFLINPTGRIILIDMELSYSIAKEKPLPAYELGTVGYISPEQLENRIPTFKEDYYGIGALIITFFTGLYPTKFDTASKEGLSEKLSFFIGSQTIANMAASCVNGNSFNRPNLATVKATIEEYKLNIESNPIDVENRYQLEKGLLEKTVQDAINGLVHPPIVMADHLWYSKFASNDNGVIQRDFIKYGGLYQGISGPLYLLAKAHQMGFDISHCEKSYYKGFDFIDQEYLSLLPRIAPGLYGGAAGMAICIAEGIRSGLLEDSAENKQRIYRCLDLPNASLEMATGIAGQVIATMRCAPFLGESRAEELLNRFVSTLLNTQQKDGSWLLVDYLGDIKGRKKIGFAYGIAGIAWVLLEYSSYSKSSHVLQSAIRSLNWLLKTSRHLDGLFKPNVYYKILGEEQERGDERKGIIFTFIKAYELVQDNYYKQIAEKALMVYPKYILKNNFSLDTGLAALGEIYLEAHRIFKSSEWIERVDWITQVFLNTSFTNQNGSKYWKMNEFDEPTADLMIGVSGIIHFLLRKINPHKMRYRILN